MRFLDWWLRWNAKLWEMVVSFDKQGGFDGPTKYWVIGSLICLFGIFFWCGYRDEKQNEEDSDKMYDRTAQLGCLSLFWPLPVMLIWTLFPLLFLSVVPYFIGEYAKDYKKERKIKVKQKQKLKEAQEAQLKAQELQVDKLLKENGIDFNV